MLTSFIVSSKAYAAVTFPCVAIALLGACAVKPDTSELLPAQTVAEREAALKAFKPWRALGSISVDSVEEGKFNATFAWDAGKQGFDIKLFGPLGIQAVHLSQDKNGAQITDRSGTVKGQDAAQLLSEVLGSNVPVDQMQSWAVGLPGDSAELARDDVGRLDTMLVIDENDMSWMVDFKRFTIFENMYLPMSVLVEGDGVTINLMFKKWSRGEVVDNGRLSIPGIRT